MVPEQENKSAGSPPEPRATPPPARRGRRSGRGRRGRGPRRPPEAGAGSEPAFEEAIPAAGGPITGAPRVEPEIAAGPPEPLRERVPAAPASVSQAVEEVSRIVDTLREALDDMEEVLETVELAERQKNADEHEIEALRRSLRHLQRPRDAGPHTPRPPHQQEH